MQDVDPVNADDLKGKVKLVYHNDPSKFKYVTPAAAEYLAPLWKLASDQDLPAEVKKKLPPAAAPAVNQKAEDQRAEALKKYLDAGGENPEHVNWTAPRLFIEAATLNKMKAQQKPETIITDASKAETTTATSVAENVTVKVEKEKKPKKGKKEAKAETATA